MKNEQQKALASAIAFLKSSYGWEFQETPGISDMWDFTIPMPCSSEWGAIYHQERRAEPDQIIAFAKSAGMADAPSEPKESVKLPEITVQLDGNEWVATDETFVDLQQSDAAYGESPDMAIVNFLVRKKGLTVKYQ